MKPRVNTSISVAAAFAAALSTVPAASQAALVQRPSAAIELSAQAPLQPSAAVLGQLNDLSTTSLIKPPWQEVWMEWDPFIEVQPD